MYSPELLNHFEHPRNAGDIADATAAVEVSNPACGDVLRLSVKVEGGRIASVGFQAKGCVPAMSCGSALTELMRDRPLADLKKIERGQIIESVGALPPASSHAAQLAMDALAALLAKISG